MQPKSKMWTLDCEDYVKNLKNDSIFELRRRRRRRLRRQFLHLMPIIPTSSSSSKPGLPPPPLPLPLPVSSSSNGDKFSWNDHLMSKVEKKNKISSEEEEEEAAAAAGLVVSSTRWNPTPEQLKALQEMYQRGVRTPSAEEIQLIAAKLRHFGRIEGKNVFYWFQNHKARERQKRRRHQPPDYYSSSSSPTFFSGNIGGTLQHSPPKYTSLGWKHMDAEQNNKKFVTASNCCLLPKGSASMHETAVTESRSNGWTHLDEKLQRQQQTFHTKTAAKEDKIFWADQENGVEDNNSRENRVLQLFPIIGRDPNPIPFRTTTNNKNKIDDEEEVTNTLSTKFTPNQFYEFL